MIIFAIIVTYNGRQWYDKCIGNLLSSDVPINIVVIDNASTDGSTEYIQEHFSSVHIIESRENLGFAKANNIGIRYAYDHGADYFFLLNQDAWVEKNTIGELIKCFEQNESAGIVSPMHLNGTYSGLDYGFAHCVENVIISDAFLKTLKLDYEVPFVNAAAWLINRNCIETIGGFDDSLFTHYGEDDNYCQRVRYHGLKILVRTTCTICHDREQRQNNDANRKQWKSIIDREELIERWSDINVQLNMDNEITKYKKEALKALLCMRLSKYRNYRNILSLLPLIKISRNKNIQKQMNWL